MCRVVVYKQNKRAQSKQLSVLPLSSAAPRVDLMAEGAPIRFVLLDIEGTTTPISFVAGTARMDRTVDADSACQTNYSRTYGAHFRVSSKRT